MRDKSDTTIIVEEVKGTNGRIARAVRCRPGDLEWRYRKGLYSEPQYQAAARFAALWQMASTGGCRTVDWGSPPNPGSQGGGLSEVVCDAVTTLNLVTGDIGKRASLRLQDHAVAGLTVSEVAARWGYGDRAMAAILDADLRAAADVFGFDPEAERRAG